MALHSTAKAEKYVNNPEIGGAEGSPTLLDLIKEMRALKVSVVTGAAAVTNIAVTGIATEDTILAVVGVDGDNATLALTVIDVTGEASITSAGNIQCATTNTSTNRLIVFWYDKTGA